MDSDSDIDCDLPPGWELTKLNGREHFKNRISNTSYFDHPLKIKKSNNCKRNKEFIQKFDAFTTAEKVLRNKDCSKDVAVVVGGCRGIGLEIVHHLISVNCRLILGCKDVSRCTENISKRIDKSALESSIIVFPLDLSSLKSVQEFSQLVLGRGDTISMVLLSGAVMYPPYSITENGFESSFQINCLSQFFLVHLLLRSRSFENVEFRIVFLACESHRLVSSFEEADVRPPRETYDGYRAYALSNLLKIVMVQEMWRRRDLYNLGSDLAIFVCHPGNMVHGTGITRYSPQLWPLWWLCSPFTKTLSQAAATPLYCLTSSSLRRFSGSYLNNGCICEPSSLALDKKLGKSVWDLIYGIVCSY